MQVEIIGCVSLCISPCKSHLQCVYTTKGNNYALNDTFPSLIAYKQEGEMGQTKH